MSVLDKEIRRVEYEKFYVENNIDVEKLIKEYETEKDANDGYMCICCYCTNNVKCPRSCCKDGKPCKDYKENVISITRDKELTLAEVIK